MDESGVRHKYQPLQRDTYVANYVASDALARWCERFDREGLTPLEGGASAGNLSLRTTQGFLITVTRSRLKRGLGPQDFVEVVRLERLGGAAFRVHFLGGGGSPSPRVPSSDAPMHHLIYAARPDVAAVFHGHDPLMLRHADSLGVPVTGQETEFGTLEDAEAALAALGQSDFLIRRGHGFVSVARTADLAGRRALEVHERAARRG